jgi:hypothetical protein
MSKRTLTDRELAARRANAKKSTGPRTREGKARSRWNALKHGLRARALIPEPLQSQESAAEFAALHEALRAELGPVGAFEELLVEAIAAAYWRLGRVQSAESRGIVSAQNSRRADLELLAGLRADGAKLGGGDAAPAPPALLPEHITLPDLDQAALLLRYEAHIERQLVRAYNLLERIQRRRHESPAPREE